MAVYQLKALCRYCGKPLSRLMHVNGGEWVHAGDHRIGQYVKCTPTHNPWPVPYGVVLPVAEEAVCEAPT